MASKSSIISIININDENTVNLGFDKGLDRKDFLVVNVEGLNPRVIIGPIFGDDKKMVKTIKAGMGISEIELKALENSGV
ncbi:hypothetical protein DRH27_03005, partial [Candidatus Falkowbacteria bacterium]